MCLQSRPLLSVNRNTAVFKELDPIRLPSSRLRRSSDLTWITWWGLDGPTRESDGPKIRSTASDLVYPGGTSYRRRQQVHVETAPECESSHFPVSPFTKPIKDGR